jgi:hypothetical protein
MKLPKQSPLEWLFWFLLTVLVVFALFTITGCYTERTATRQVVKAQAVYPAVVAGFCAKLYPPTNSTDTKTEYIKGDTVRTVDTTVVFDTLTNTVYKYINRYYYIHDTAFITKKEVQVNTAAVEALQYKVDDLKDTINSKNVTIGNLWLAIKILGWVGGILLLYTIARWILKAYTRITLP